VIGAIETGMYDYDSSIAFVSLTEAQRLLGLPSRIHAYELKVSRIEAADVLAKRIGEGLGFPFWTMDWKRMSRNLFAALKLEKLVEDLVNKVEEPCRIALKDAGLSPQDINEVILVGGK